VKPAERQLIRQSSLFKDASPAGFEAVLEAGVVRSLERDTFFFMQGDPATHSYVLLNGRVKMLQYTPNGHQIILRMITPGQTFAGIALLRPEAGYPASAQCVEDSQAAAWSTQDLRRLAAAEPSISLNTMQLMHGYILELQSRQQALVGGRVEQRVAIILLKLAAQCGKKDAAGMLIDLPLTRQDIAEMSGTTLFTVSRTLNEWERQGLLKIGRERVVICEPHSLVQIAEGLD
jgi:CRP-like cAMP-binding protein